MDRRGPGPEAVSSPAPKELFYWPWKMESAVDQLAVGNGFYDLKSSISLTNEENHILFPHNIMIIYRSDKY